MGMGWLLGATSRPSLAPASACISPLQPHGLPSSNPIFQPWCLSRAWPMGACRFAFRQTGQAVDSRHSRLGRLTAVGKLSTIHADQGQKSPFSACLRP
ncbi:hypothetical protein Veis_0652 [Verminephrobacter eiseniae EF01-2]|uniref:Uncharacterized protein n=1 Tax=Verminephrobacter eiseniae (strain EF01-2) TaxID=391735 RepID=A1WFM8_VEREI|nr:hypothetical protein Veis_0652 [Verminephrobacter eiseniae EF01-2]